MKLKREDLEARNKALKIALYAREKSLEQIANELDMAKSTIQKFACINGIPIKISARVNAKPVVREMIDCRNMPICWHYDRCYRSATCPAGLKAKLK